MFAVSIRIYLFGSLVVGAGGDEIISLVRLGSSDYQIVVGESAIPSEQYAAQELQRFLAEMTGAKLPIVTDAAPVRACEVLVGKSGRFGELVMPIDVDRLQNEEFLIETQGRRLIIVGGGTRGTLYGVYAFLEDQLGCRWYTRDVSKIPRRAGIDVAPLKIREAPAFEYRAVGWISATDPIWAARNRVNVGSMTERQGGSVSILGGAHNFHRLVPPSEYYEIHPEYYPLINGKRVYQNAQLCLTHPEVVRVVADKIICWLDEHPDTRLVGVGQEDWGGWCECPECRRVVEQEESQAGVLVHFLNQVAERVVEKFPDVYLISLAYQATRKPPKMVRPHPHVIPWLCGIECCYSHPIATCPLNASFKKDLEDWAAKADKLYVFDYTANFEHYVMPHPNLRVLQPNLELFANKQVRGVYASGNAGAGSELGELRAFLLAKLLWNPDADVDALREEFMGAYYGKAAEPLEKYLALMHDKVERDDIHCTIVANPRMPYLVPEMIGQAKLLFDEAERLAEDKAILERVKVARLAIQHVELEWSKPTYRYADGWYKPETLSGAEELAREFVAVAERNGVTQIFEMNGPKPPSWHLQQQVLWKKPWPAVRLENERLRVDLVPGWGGRIVSIYYKPMNCEVLLPAQPDGREYPKSGGMEEYSERGGRTAGWDQEYHFENDASRRQVRMWAELPNGLRFDRCVTLSETEPSLTIASSLTNISAASRAACLRSNPKFCLGKTEDTTVWFFTTAGTKQSYVLTVPPEKTREALVFSGDNLPNGVWHASNRVVGIGLETAFDVREVQSATLDWLPARQRFFFELQTPEETLAPSETLTLTQTITVSEM